MIFSDYHIHTSFSPDSKMDRSKAVRAAIAAGVTHLCFTEHMDLGHHIEVNTSGIDRGGHVFPHPSIIRRYKELGGRFITIGSDAHREENVGAYIKEAVEIIKNAGVKEIALFQNRVPGFVRIGSE